MKGYSLLELVISLALLGFIAVAMNGGVRFGARAWEASEEKVEAAERMQGAQNLLRTLLQRAMPRELDPAFAVDLDLFRGTAGTLSFTASAPSAFGAEGLTRFDLRVEGGPGGQQLLLAWKGANTPAQPNTQTLVAGADAIAIAYAARDGASFRWTDNWSDQSGAPQLVMIRATFPPGSGRRWPPLIVRTRITQDPLCVYNADTFGCPHA
ncbi:MAG: prepilin-type N-terminal cleavage/methylation domain-containing protein [Alphaproteobacteria bacterium]|nr:prepilin-type N-terminal cleavage/methylation domain-containing protein [Alphaproteobacteria bacterium]